MSEHWNVPPAMTTAAIEGSTGLRYVYERGGGSLSDLRTDVSHAIAAALATLGRPDRRQNRGGYCGPERRRVA